MAWQRKLTETITDSLRLIYRAALLFCVITLSCATLYLCVWLSLRIVQFLYLKYLKEPWA